MYYLLYRKDIYHYCICDNDGYVLTTHPITGHTYHPTPDEAFESAKVRHHRKQFTFNTNIPLDGDTILWYYPLTTLENPRQNYPELFI